SLDITPHHISTLFPYTTLFRSTKLLLNDACGSSARDGRSYRPSRIKRGGYDSEERSPKSSLDAKCSRPGDGNINCRGPFEPGARSEEHTSELQSLRHLVCRLLL